MALVLIVDDSPTEQHVFCKALERHGYDTVVANDGEEALVTAEQVVQVVAEIGLVPAHVRREVRFL